MLEWHAVYKDNPQEEEASTEEHAPRAAVLKRFKDAASLGMHNGRAVIGMWLIDPNTEQEDPIAIYGRLPLSIRGRTRHISRGWPKKSPAGEGGAEG